MLNQSFWYNRTCCIYDAHRCDSAKVRFKSCFTMTTSPSPSCCDGGCSLYRKLSVRSQCDMLAIAFLHSFLKRIPQKKKKSMALHALNRISSYIQRDGSLSFDGKPNTLESLQVEAFPIYAHSKHPSAWESDLSHPVLGTPKVTILRRLTTPVSLQKPDPQLRMVFLFLNS